MATSPYEIVAGPATVFLAPVATAFPGIAVSMPTGAWVDLGDTEGGVTARHTQSVELLRVDQATGPKKAIRSEEGLEIEFQLAELTIENFGKALNNATVTTGGSPTTKSIKLHQGFDVAQWAFVVRGPSPYGNWNLQYEVPVVVQVEEPEVAFVRDDKSVLQVKFTAIEDPLAATEADRFGVLRAQSA